MKSQKLIDIVIKQGWNVVRQKGSHIHFKHLFHHGLVTIPHPVLDLPKSTMRSILKQAKINVPIYLLKHSHL